MRGILFLLVPLFIFGQDPGSISGKIEDKNGEGLPGVNIMLKGTYYGTASDKDGGYKIEKIQIGTKNILENLQWKPLLLVQSLGLKNGVS